MSGEPKTYWYRPKTNECQRLHFTVTSAKPVDWKAVFPFATVEPDIDQRPPHDQFFSVTSAKLVDVIGELEKRGYRSDALLVAKWNMVGKQAAAKKKEVVATAGLAVIVPASTSASAKAGAVKSEF